MRIFSFQRAMYGKFLQGYKLARDEIKIRKARPEDYSAVFNFSKNLFGGNDIVCYHYDKYLEDEKRIFQVGTYEKNVVGLIMWHIVDDGLRVQGQHSRLDQKFTSHAEEVLGLPNNYSNMVFKGYFQLHEEMPNLTDKLSYTFSEVGVAKSLKKWNPSVLERNVAFGKGFAKNFMNHNQEPKENTDLLTAVEDKDILKNILTNKSLIRENLLVVNWETYGLKSSNSSIIPESPKLDLPGEKFTIVTTRDVASNDIVAVSFAKCFKVVFGYHCTLDFYCKDDDALLKEDDENVLIQHITTQIKSFASGLPEAAFVSMDVIFPSTIQKKFIQDTFCSRYHLTGPITEFSLFACDLNRKEMSNIVDA